MTKGYWGIQEKNEVTQKAGPSKLISNQQETLKHEVSALVVLKLPNAVAV